jgi:hypothetical protein
MKHYSSLILLSALLFLTPAVARATPISKATANAYYSNCMKQADPRLSPQNQQALCACTSSQMMQSLTMEDMQAMGQKTAAGNAALNKMLINVYAPCITYPVQDLLNSQCMSDPKVKAIGSAMNMGRLCGCMSKRTGDWYAVQGRALMAQILAQNPNVVDIITPVMQSKQFNDQAYANLRACLKGG